MNLVIVEDSELILSQLLRIIHEQPRIKITGLAKTEDEAISLIKATSPDAILLDLGLAPGSGLRVLEAIRGFGSGARVLVLTNNSNEHIRRVCTQYGISGFYDKSQEAYACLDKLFSFLPQLPDNEVERLLRLQSTQLLDTPEQEVYDNITKLACRVTGMSASMITLVDKDRQWFLSRVGVDTKETSRTVAFCAHAILQQEILEVKNAKDDVRFNDNPLVIGAPYIRFYAGVPLILSSGEALGTLCVLDTKPNELNTHQREALKTLARSALSEIELHMQLVELEKEVTRRKLAEEHIKHLSTRDPLTALPNRSAFRESLSQQLKVDKARCAVIYINPDRFKLINDTLGHDAGDDLLSGIAHRLTQLLSDTNLIARIGSDEFAVIATDVSGAHEASLIAENIVASLAVPFELKGRQVFLEVSIGISLSPDDGESPESLARRADLALYHAKHLGGNRICIYSSDLNDYAQDTIALETNLRLAIDRNELEVYYQPQVSLISSKVSGVEALVRWNHPHFGLTSPQVFIPLAEERGLIDAIGHFVLDSALQQLTLWDKDGMVIPKVAINVSALELKPGYVDAIQAALTKYQIRPSRLELEITESVLVSDGVETMQILEHLRGLGITIAVDDFGVGYSSLGQLRRLPIDALKVDKSFIDNIHNDAEDEAIVNAIVTMARALGLRTIAEGAETDQQLSSIEKLECDCVQGYVLGKPMSSTELSKWMNFNPVVN